MVNGHWSHRKDETCLGEETTQSWALEMHWEDEVMLETEKQSSLIPGVYSVPHRYPWCVHPYFPKQCAQQSDSEFRLWFPHQVRMEARQVERWGQVQGGRSLPPTEWRRHCHGAATRMVHITAPNWSSPFYFQIPQFLNTQVCSLQNCVLPSVFRRVLAQRWEGRIYHDRKLKLTADSMTTHWVVIIYKKLCVRLTLKLLLMRLAFQLSPCIVFQPRVNN